MPKKNKILELNDEQQAAVNVREGHYAVLSGPGSGKTAVLVARFNALISSGECHADIISLTFTKAAAREMQSRANVNTTMIVGERPFGFRTFHSIALDFSVRERDAFPFPLAAFPLATGGQVWKFTGEVARRYAGMDVKQLLSYISLQKRNGVWPQEAVDAAQDIRDRTFALAYKEYEERCRKLGVLDFDDLLLYMVEILENYPDVRKRWAYKWVQIDEAGDADLTQWKLVQLLSKKHGNVFAVGDFRQVIYQWRGAEPKLFKEFHAMFPNCTFIYLNNNYRSTKAITEFCQAISPDKDDAAILRTENEQGEPVEIKGFASNLLEARWVVERIKEIENLERVPLLAQNQKSLAV